MRCRPGFYFNAGHTEHGSEFWSHQQAHLCSCCKVHTQVWDSWGRELWSWVWSPFCNDLRGFLEKLGARCSPVPAPFSILGHMLAVLALQPAQVAQPRLLSLIPKELKRTRMLSHSSEENHSSGGCSPKRREKLQLVHNKCIAVQFVQFWLQLHQQHIFFCERGL